MKVTGLWGCDCHPFDNYEESQKAKNQKLPIGSKVKNRCTQQNGSVFEICESKGYVIVKYGQLPKHHQLEHKQNLILLPD